MLYLINDMLDFSSIVGGRFAKRIDCFNLREHITEAVDLLRVLVEEKGIELHEFFSERLPEMVHSDNERLQ